MPAAALAIPAVLGAVGVGGSIFSGITGSNAAKDAAAIQSAAATKAGQQVTDAAAAVNPQITTAAQQAGAGVTGAAGTAATNATNAAGVAGAGVTGQSSAANDILDPYSQAGQAAADAEKASIGTGPGGMPSASQIQMDPGFAARLSYGIRATDRGAAARGGVSSGSAAMALNDYAQTQASNEYQNAFNRFLQNRASLGSIAGQGIQAGTTQGQNLIGAARYAGDTGIQANEFGGQLNTGAAQYAGDRTYGAATTTAANTLGAAEKSADYLTQRANAQAAGKVGAANAVSGAVGSGIGALTSAGAIYSSLKNPIKYGIVK